MEPPNYEEKLELRDRFKDYLFLYKGYNSNSVFAEYDEGTAEEEGEETGNLLLFEEKSMIGIVIFEVYTQAINSTYTVYRRTQNLHAFLVGLESNGEFELHKFTNITANSFQEPERIDDFPTFDELRKQRITTLERKLPGCHSDQTIGKDLLGISKEVEAVSNLLSMKQVENLAIGLFGNWGSGKSFFMKKVQEQLERQMKTESADVFHQHIIQIEFNAWHYMDSNLLVSMTSHIFEEILKKLKENNTSIEELLEELPSLKRMSSELKELEKRKDEIANELKVNKTLMGQKLPSYLEEWIEHGTLFSGLKGNLAKARVFFKLLTHLPHKDWIKMAIMVAGFALLTNWKWNLIDINPILMKIGGPIASLSGMYFTWKEMILSKPFQETKDLFMSLNKEMESKEHLREEKRRIEFKIQDKHQELETIKKDGKIIKYYIEERVASNEYKKELGFINMIRKDFERLSELLTENQEKPYGIDRIILYIDDLDRCPPKKVIEIINAIHLLLSSKLFMVVVAVDIRWISKCLLVEYEQLFAGDSNSAASTYDYLEKIFQIPIRIQQISLKERSRYIRGLLKDDVITNAGNMGVNLGPPPDFGGNVDEPEEDEPDKPRIQGKDIRMSINKLALNSDDINQMTHYIDILGNTPRNLKRFVNIFRLIKAKSNDNMSTGRVLFLLSIAVGFPHTSYLIFKEIMIAKDGDLILEVIEKLGKSLPKENDEIKKLLAFLQKDQGATNFDIAGLKPLAPSVSRYSFYLNDVD